MKQIKEFAGSVVAVGMIAGIGVVIGTFMTVLMTCMVVSEIKDSLGG